MKIYEDIKSMKSKPLRWLGATAFTLFFVPVFIVFAFFHVIFNEFILEIPSLFDQIKWLYKGNNNVE
jgi:hypothetical protein